MDHSQFTEGQLTEAYRRETMQQLERQTKALEKINGTLTVFLVLFVIGAVLVVLSALSARFG